MTAVSRRPGARAESKPNGIICSGGKGKQKTRRRARGEEDVGGQRRLGNRVPRGTVDGGTAKNEGTPNAITFVVGY